MSVASEAEAAALFTNMKEGVIQFISLEEMQWPQPPTPITVDNSTVAGLVWDTIKTNKSQAMDMCLNWIQDQAQQRPFLVTWAPGKLIKPITLQNCMHPDTTVACVLYISTHHPHQQTQLTCLLPT